MIIIRINLKTKNNYDNNNKSQFENIKIISKYIGV